MWVETLLLIVKFRNEVYVTCLTRLDVSFAGAKDCRPSDSAQIWEYYDGKYLMNNNFNGGFFGNKWFW